MDFFRGTGSIGKELAESLALKPPWLQLSFFFFLSPNPNLGFQLALVLKKNKPQPKLGVPIGFPCGGPCETNQQGYESLKKNWTPGPCPFRTPPKVFRSSLLQWSEPNEMGRLLDEPRPASGRVRDSPRCRNLFFDLFARFWVGHWSF